MKKIDVVALGELLIDFTCVGTDADGYPAMQAHPGGAPANFLAALSKFGMKTALLGKVGTDAFGELLLTTLQKADIKTRGLLRDPAVFTTLAFVTLDEKGDRAFSFARKPGADTCLHFEELDLELIDEAKVFHFGTLSLTDEPARTATVRAVEYAKKRGKLVTCDPNLREPLWDDLSRAKEQMLWSLSRADIIKISEEEVQFLFCLGAEEGAVHIIKELGAKLVFVTCGAKGCYYQNAAAHGFVPALQGIRAVDTTGAGDIFFGSAMHRILELDTPPEELTDAQLQEITRFACASAGLSTTRPGGISSVPDYENVQNEVKKGHDAY